MTKSSEADVHLTNFSYNAKQKKMEGVGKERNTSSDFSLTNKLKNKNKIKKKQNGLHQKFHLKKRGERNQNTHNSKRMNKTIQFFFSSLPLSFGAKNNNVEISFLKKKSKTKKKFQHIRKSTIHRSPKKQIANKSNFLLEGK